jgi:hypothetical protein
MVHGEMRHGHSEDYPRHCWAFDKIGHRIRERAARHKLRNPVPEMEDPEKEEE